MSKVPFSIEFPLNVSGVVRADAHLLRNNVYRWLKIAGADREAHQGESAPRPFRVSTLASEGRHGSFRITLLDDTLLDPLTMGMEQAPFVLIHERRVHFSGKPDVIGARYEDMLRASGSQTVVTLEFLTPTAFHVADLAYVLPDPLRVFTSYHGQWNRFCAEDCRILDVWLEWVREHIVVSDLRIKTDELVFETHRQKGFVGLVAFAAPKLVPGPEGLEPLRIFNFLADYSFFCGTGHKTSQGMGQTRRVYAS